MTNKDKEDIIEQDDISLEGVELEEVLDEMDEHNEEVTHQQFEEMRNALTKAQDEALRSRAEMENIR
ncbi:MAG: hypothetical protein KAJ95_05690, partial [Gammaproteobacteria bacterium]|nr:hypothetical protein [Gammaproteobacteria bacterium]